MTVDAAGDLYMADLFNSVVRRVDAVTGIITTVAGDGTRGYAGDGRAATSSELSYPSGVAFDGEGNLYIADSGNNRIRRVAATTGIITTVVGTGTAGYSGDGGPATAAKLGASEGFAPPDSCCGVERRLDVASDSAGDLFLADAGNKVIRWVDAKTGIITTVAGNGSTYPVDSVPATRSGLDYPTGVALDQQGNLYIADQSNSTIRKVNSSQSSVSFPVTVVGQSATPQSVLLANAGSAALALSGISITGPNAGDFQQTSSCGTSISAGGSCTISLVFTPAAVGTRTATINIVDDTGGTAGSVQTISLAGTGAQ
jgi:streptogramin lyase